MRIDVVTIFPQYLAPMSLSLLGRAREQGLVDLRVHDLRSYTDDRHRSVDDTPYGGGAGMVMTPEPWGAALDQIRASGQPAGPEPRLLVPTPAGRRFDQSMATELAAEPWLILACGRYEGIDQRVVDVAAATMRVDEVSIGDYVLAGGEAAAIVVVEAVTRLLPGVVGNVESLAEESHVAGLLECPVYTKPATWRGADVPPVLLGGHHRQVARWRRDQALTRTARNRPDLLARMDPQDWDERDRQVLAEHGWVIDPTSEAAPGHAAAPEPAPAPSPADADGDGGFPLPAGAVPD